ncbi:BTAD domain-containing putative transcriptional regulator [Agromyces sp. Marseille-P2726]|uniref:nSTAND1 domain-containing NTPase n=1 Tax=Agromyces sp. Marseille-P2726 TaxID=2709132 RepID=UPI00156E26A6|nr:BTAD domain-containing putative transcriptional regulator [Agromyces sp. Marseille-P2726]
MGLVVFGPLTLDGATLSPRERSVLSALVLRAGRPVTTDELADALWGDEPPGTWAKQLQASVGRVRSAIGRDAIETEPGAYVLRVDPDSIDVQRFEQHAESARLHLENDPARALDAAERALALWRGSPYADLASWPPALGESERLDELRMELEELRVDAHLKLGEHTASVADAERLVREAPLRERRWVLLATALYRSGRQADALAAVRAARERLADELGAEPGAELAELELGILRHDDSLDLIDAPVTPSSACPYRGLQPFGVEDEDIFFGRSTDIGAALTRLSGSRFLAIAGASGSGKSSLVRAGVVPALQRLGDRVTILTPELHLDVRIRDAVWGAGHADVVIVDQFEEVFHAGEADVDAAARAIFDTVSRGTIIVLVVRSDFLDDCAEHPDLAPLVAEGVHLVGPMSPDALREAIEEPAHRAGLRLEPGLVELILRDAVGEAGALPHLSHALVETWLRREGATMTVAGYEASGGISGAIAQSADRLYQSMSTEQREVCRSLLLRLMALAPDGSPIRRRVSSKPLRTDAARDEVLTMLARSRLVSAEADSVEVAHESLATAWPRLQSWLAEDAESARMLTAVAAAAEAWNAADRPDDDLYRGVRLQAALEWRDASPSDLTDVESAFLDASADRATAEQEQLAERARRDRRQNRRLRALLVGAAGLIVLLIGAGSVAVVSSREAGAQRDSAAIEALVGTALALRSSERDVSALLAAEAYRRWPDDPRTRSGLMGVLQGAGGFLGNTIMADGGNTYGSVIPGTGQVVIVSTAGDAAVRDAETGDLVRELDLGFEPDPPEPEPLVEVSGDGRMAAVLWSARTQLQGPTWYGTSTQSKVVVFDLETGRRLVGPELIPVGTGSLAANADGSIIAIADARDGAVTLLHTMDGSMSRVADETTVPLDRDSYAAALAFDDQDRLLVGRLDDRVDVIDAASGSITHSLLVAEDSAHVAMAVSRSGVVVAAGDRQLIAFDPDDGRVRWSTDISRPYMFPCNWLAVAESVQRAFCGSRFGRISAYSLVDGTLLPEEELGPLYGEVGPIDVVDDGATLVTISGSHPLISRWRLDGVGLGRRLLASGQMVVGPYSIDGSAIVVAPQAVVTSTPPIWDAAVVLETATGDVAYGFGEPVTDVVWARGRLIARSAVEQMFRFIDTQTWDQVGRSIWTVERFVPSLDGEYLEAIRTDGRIQAFDPQKVAAAGASWAVAGLADWISISPDDRRIAVTHRGDEMAYAEGVGFSTAEDQELHVSIADAETGKVLYDEPMKVSAHVLLEDGELIGLEDNRIGRYQTDPLARIGTVAGAAGGTFSPSLSRDARTLLVMAADGTAMVYDAPSGTRLGEPLRTDSRTLGVAVLRPDGREMAVSMPSGVMLWDLDPDHQFQFACQLAGRELTEDEWNTYLGDLGDPQSTCGFD